jgi:hypothetical protein
VRNILHQRKLFLFYPVCWSDLRQKARFGLQWWCRGNCHSMTFLRLDNAYENHGSLITLLGELGRFPSPLTYRLESTLSAPHDGERVME